MAIVERDAWFKSPMCFVRDGPACLATMIHQQKLGLDMLRTLNVDGDSEVRLKYDDHLPSQAHIDVKPRVLGGTRRHIASDQAMRARGMVGPRSLLPAQDLTPSLVVKPEKADTTKSNSTTSTAAHDPELSDTDNEEQSDCRRRSARGPGKRKHLVSPSVARGRVLSLSRPSSTRKRIKTEPSSASDKLSIMVAIPGSDRSPSPHVSEADTLHTTSTVGNSAVCVSGTCVNPVRQSRYVVNRGHLAALMAVGHLPVSPS